jgi:FtsH-binding integral membrane protein
VYNYMALGLAITGAAALGTFLLAVDRAGGTAKLTAFGQLIYHSPLKWVVIFAPLAMVFLLSFGIQRLSVGAAQLAFWAYAALMGVSLSAIFLVYTGQSITQVFFVTAAAFGALSLYGYTTQRDLSPIGSFLIMGVFGIIIASLVNIWLASSALQFAVSVIGVLVFAGLTAYDTQRIKEMYDVNDDGTLAGRKAIMGALSLYLDFINLFMMLLQLFGRRD